MTSAARCSRLRHRSSEACAPPHFRRPAGRAAPSRRSRHRLGDATGSLPRISRSRRRRSPDGVPTPANPSPRRSQSRSRHPNRRLARALLPRSRRGSWRQPPLPRLSPSRRRRRAGRRRSRPVPTRRAGKRRVMTIRSRRARPRNPRLLPSRRARRPPPRPPQRRHLPARPRSPTRPSRTARTMATETAGETVTASRTGTGTVTPTGTTASALCEDRRPCAPASRDVSVLSASP